MPTFGVYPVADALTAGDEISSTYEGRHITLLESDLVHPTHADGMVDKGDPIVSATGTPAIVGVAFKSAAAATDRVAIDTEGIWILDVVATNDAGISAVAGGDRLYINTTTAVISKIQNVATQVYFGVALGIIVAGSTNTIAVKVHQDPSAINGGVRMYETVADDSYGLDMYTILAGGKSEGMNGYFEGHITAAIDGHTYGLGSWINVDGASYLAAGHICTPFEGGIYAGDAQAAARVVFAGQHQAILTGAPASLHAWRLNSTQTITALIAAANPGTVAFQASALETSTPIGSIPLVDVVGVGVGYVRLYDDYV